MASVNKEDFDRLHEKVDRSCEALARIEGKLDAKLEEKKSYLTLSGLISAIALGIWNLIK